MTICSPGEKVWGHIKSTGAGVFSYLANCLSDHPVTRVAEQGESVLYGKWLRPSEKWPDSGRSRCSHPLSTVVNQDRVESHAAASVARW